MKHEESVDRMSMGESYSPEGFKDAGTSGEGTTEGVLS